MCDAVDVCPIPGAGLTPFSRSVVEASAGADALSMADLDGDGREDVLAGWWDRFVGWSPAQGDSFGPRVVLNGAKSVGSAVAVDWDGDGDLDVAASTTDPWFQHELDLYENLGGRDAGGSAVVLGAAVPGADPVPAPACAATASGLVAPRVVASGVGDASGEVVFSRPVPAALAGRTTRYQVVDLGTCRVSPVASLTW